MLDVVPLSFDDGGEQCRGLDLSYSELSLWP